MQNSNTINTFLPSMTGSNLIIDKTITVPATAKIGKTRARLIRSENIDDLFTYDPSFILDSSHFSPKDFSDFSIGASYDFDINIVNNSLGINKKALSDLIKIYPNPTKGKIFIENNSNTNLKFSIADLFGNKISNTQNDHIDLSNYSTGIYIINITDNEGNKISKKIIVE